jgi:hypothetical protein
MGPRISTGWPLRECASPTIMTRHGFDEFFGYLYHLDAMEDPSHRNYPPALKDVVGPRNMVHSPTRPRRVGHQQLAVPPGGA